MRLAERIPGVERSRGVLSYRPMNLAKAPVVALAAAYLGGDLGPLMGDSRWGERVRELARQLAALGGSTDTRKFVFEGSRTKAGATERSTRSSTRFRRNTILRFDHKGEDGVVRRHRVQPLSLAVRDRKLHLLARVAAGEEASSFVIEDLTSVMVDRSTFEYPAPHDYDPLRPVELEAPPRRSARR